MRIDGVILRTPDVERLTEFWGSKVGFEVTGQLDDYSFIDGGGFTLTIAFLDREIADDSWTEVVIVSETVESDYEAMAARGVPFESPLGAPIMSRDGKDLVAAHFQDPDGHYGRLTGWVDAS
jgi:catechol 2,3-dioxygenase-like lactoylglutathione lyase family enzyme